jgi:hypothetical protein
MCIAYMHQLRRQFGNEPEGASLRMLSMPFEAGSAYTVVCDYEPDNEEALAYAVRCREEAWPEWDSDAQWELANSLGPATTPKEGE